CGPRQRSGAPGDGDHGPGRGLRSDRGGGRAPAATLRSDGLAHPAPRGVSLTDGAPLLWVALVVPMLAALLALALGGRAGERIQLALLPTGLAIAFGIAAQAARSARPLRYHLGGWAPPLGVALRADDASGAMLVVTAVVLCAVALYARSSLGTPKGVSE